MAEGLLDMMVVCGLYTAVLGLLHSSCHRLLFSFIPYFFLHSQIVLLLLILLLCAVTTHAGATLCTHEFLARRSWLDRFHDNYRFKRRQGWKHASKLFRIGLSFHHPRFSSLCTPMPALC